MKNLFFSTIAMMAILFASCEQNQQTSNTRESDQRDSLQRVIDQKDMEINDMLGTLNEIQEGFREINEAENKVGIARNGEGANQAQQIKENIQFISNTMQRNRELIAKLRQQLRESTIKGDQLQATIKNLIAQLEEKDQQLQQLRADLAAKDIHISELDETIAGLNNDVTTLTEENNMKTETISNQDQQIHTAWYAFGTKKELKEQRITDGNSVLTQNFNRNYFTKIDIRVTKEVKLYSKSAKILTMHPSGSYTLQQDVNKQYTLRITNPDLFWSTSKYLVVQVK